ncbi:MAG TPA: hypothetical protein VFR71_02965 [Methyloceanibacter sp.]|nr:hypothetical protein [Methyloceanibacter sp.]
MFDVLEHSAEEPGHTGLLDWPEPIVEGKIDLCPVLYEALATALDPYPQAGGGELHLVARGRPSPSIPPRPARLPPSKP